MSVLAPPSKAKLALFPPHRLRQFFRLPPIRTSRPSSRPHSRPFPSPPGRSSVLRTRPAFRKESMLFGVRSLRPRSAPRPSRDALPSLHSGSTPASFPRVRPSLISMQARQTTLRLLRRRPLSQTIRLLLPPGNLRSEERRVGKECITQG